MKNLITYLSKKSLSLENGSEMTRKWFGNDSGMTRFSLASLICVLMLTLGVGEMWATDPTWTYEFTAAPTITSDQFTVNSATWSISRTTGNGSPTTATGNDNSVTCMKLGSGGKNYYSSIVLSTDYFEDYNVKSVYIVGAVNSSSASITVTQGTGGGAVTIGSATISQAYTASWQSLSACQKTINTNKGNGGTLTISISPSSCAFSLRQITVTYEEGSSCSGTKLGTPVVTATTSNTQVVLSWDAVANASSYKLKWNGGSWTAATSPVTKTGLTNGTEYTYQVQAIGDGDEYCDGDASEEASITAGPCYTVSFSTGTGNPTVTSVTEEENEGCIELPDGPTPACSSDGWEFAGWSETAYIVDNTTNVGRLRMPGDYYCPDGANRTLYAVYRKLTSGTSSATFTANSRDNLTQISSGTYRPAWWYHTSTGAEFYIEDYGYYSYYDVFDVDNSINNGDGWALFDAHRPITTITLTSLSGSPSVSLTSKEDVDGNSVSISSSTITCSGNVTQVLFEAPNDGEVTFSAFTVNYKNCKFLSNPSCCDKAVAVSYNSAGSTHVSAMSFSAASTATCSETAADRQVTVTITPASCYTVPSSTRLTPTGTGADYVSGPTDNGDGTYSFVYQFAQDATGTSTFAVSLSAKTTYTVSYAAGSVPSGGGSISGSHANDTKTCGTSLTLPGVVFTTTGYTQTGWAKTDGGSKTNNLSGSYTTDAAQTFYPVWTVNSYTVTWMVNNTTYSEGGSTSVNHGSRVSTLPTAPDPGDYCGDKFVGWTTDEEYVHGTSPLFTAAGSAPTATGAQTFYAVFADYAD